MKILTEKEFLESSKAAVAFGVNFNGAAVSNHMTMSQAIAKGMTHNANNAVTRHLDCYYSAGHYGDDNYKYDSTYIRALLDSAIWNDKEFFVRYPLANGTYDVFFAVAENYKDYHRSFTILAEGHGIYVKAMRKGEFTYVSTRVEVTDGFLDVKAIGNCEVHLMAMHAIKV